MFPPSIFLSLPGVPLHLCGPPSLSDAPPLPRPSRSGSGWRGRRVGDRRQLGDHQDVAATGRRGAAHRGGDAWGGTGGGEEDRGGVISQDDSAAQNAFQQPPEKRSGFQVHSGLCLFFSGGFHPPVLEEKYLFFKMWIFFLYGASHLLFICLRGSFTFVTSSCLDAGKEESRKQTGFSEIRRRLRSLLFSWNLYLNIKQIIIRTLFIFYKTGEHCLKLNAQLSYSDGK